MLKVNGKIKICPNCKSDDLRIIGYDDYRETHKVICGCCDEEVMQGELPVYKVKEINIFID